MNTSTEGRRLIYSFEGLHKALGDGRYAAYLCPAGVPTIYAGCTNGVKIGMVITTEEGEAMFAREIAKFEDAVTQLVTVPINQNEFDALVSFAYNVGIAAFKGSTLLKKLNKGDRKGAAAEFAKWNKATVKGKKVTLAGLVSRRTREAALFQKPVSAPDEPSMPQSVTASKEPPSRKTVAATVAAAGTGVMQLMPADPLGTAEGLLSTGNRVRGVAKGSHDLGLWALALPNWPYVIGAGAAAFGLYWVLCHWLPKKQQETA